MKKPLRGAVVGYGFIMEKGHIAAYGERSERALADGRVPDVEIVAVADVCRERRDMAAKRFPGIRTYADFLELLDAEAGNLDFVDIATPPAKHAAVARAELGRGQHVGGQASALSLPQLQARPGDPQRAQDHRIGRHRPGTPRDPANLPQHPC